MNAILAYRNMQRYRDRASKGEECEGADVDLEVVLARQQLALPDAVRIGATSDSSTNRDGSAGAWTRMNDAYRDRDGNRDCVGRWHSRISGGSAGHTWCASLGRTRVLLSAKEHIEFVLDSCASIHNVGTSTTNAASQLGSSTLYNNRTHSASVEQRGGRSQPRGWRVGVGTFLTGYCAAAKQLVQGITTCTEVRNESSA